MMIKLITKSTVQQMARYLLCGSVSTAFDFILYLALVKIDLNINIAKAAGFLSASVVSYFLNRKFTFTGTQSSLRQFTNFFLIHGLAMIIDVAVNKEMLILLSSYRLQAPRLVFMAAFIVATGVSVIANFSGQKFWVFTDKTKGKNKGEQSE